MGKMDEFNAGRETGFVLFYKLYQEGGIEAVEKEMKFRKWSKINTSLSSKELDKACYAIKQMTLDTVLTLTMATLRDAFGFGKERLNRFRDAFEAKASCLADGFAHGRIGRRR